VLNGGNAISNTVKLSSLTGKQYNVPSYLSVDRFYNIWVALYGQELLLKLNPTLNLILSAVPNSTLGLSAEGSLLLAPPIVETDSNNDVWASYAHPLSSTVIKFDGSTGQELFRLTDLPLSSVPVSLTLNPENNLWVACRESNKVQLHSTLDGSLLKTISGLYRPSYIMCDRASNLWITHGYNFCSKYNPNTEEIKHYKIDNINKTISEVTGYTSEDIQKALYENEIWGGLTVDVFDKVWAVDSEQNIVYVLNSQDPLTTLNSFVLMPEADTNYVVIGGTNYVTEVPGDKVRSAQAAGDWSGNRWYQKYSGSYSSLPVRGISAPFKVYDLDTSFTIAKVNEEFNCAEYFKSLALPEILKDNEALFNEFLAAVVGNGNPTKEDIGRVAYERIANFVQTHGDFETSEIKQLLSFAEQLSVPAKTFGEDFPAEINRLLNLFSIPKHKLRGQIAYESDISKNVGVLLTESSYVSAGQYIFVKDRFYNNYQLIAVSPLSSGNTLIDIEEEKEILTLDGRPIELPSPATNYPLSSIQVEGLRTPLFDNYYFFEYNEEKIGYKGNVINWDSDFTAIDYDFSTYNQWYGDGGLVESTFNNILTKRLFLDN
jgi:hypothetical protein